MPIALSRSASRTAPSMNLVGFAPTTDASFSALPPARTTASAKLLMLSGLPIAPMNVLMTSSETTGSSAFSRACATARTLFDMWPFRNSSVVPTALLIHWRSREPAASVSSPGTRPFVPPAATPIAFAPKRPSPAARNSLPKPAPEFSDAYSRKLSADAIDSALDMRALFPVLAADASSDSCAALTVLPSCPTSPVFARRGFTTKACGIMTMAPRTGASTPRMPMASCKVFMAEPSPLPETEYSSEP